MLVERDYYEAARENEEVFRNILRDLKEHRSERPMGIYLPDNLETEAPLEEIFRRYSEGERTRQFTISGFSRTGDKAELSFGDIAPLSGGGASLEYEVANDSQVRFSKAKSAFMC